MKFFTSLFLVIIMMSCQNNQDNFDKSSKEIDTTKLDYVAKGKQIFEGVGNCQSCHLANQKVIGPSLKDIAEAYRVSGANMIDFLKGKSEPIISNGNFEVMKINLEITKKMSDEDLKSLEAYLLSF